MAYKLDRKLRLYLDTSVVSAIHAPHKPAIEFITHRFFEYVKEHDDEYELVTSPVCKAEIDQCSEPLLSQFSTFLEELNHVKLEDDENADSLADAYVDGGVLNNAHYRDLLHIAYAVVNRCDYIVSWNFKHFVNPKTMTGVNEVNQKHGYPSVMIITPEAITGEQRRWA